MLIGYPIKEYYVCNERPRIDDEGMPILEDGIVVKDEECMWVSADVLDTYISEGYRIKDNISRMGYALPTWVPTNENPNGTILILDDFNRADPRFIQATMELKYFAYIKFIFYICIE